MDLGSEIVPTAPVPSHDVTAVASGKRARSEGSDYKHEHHKGKVFETKYCKTLRNGGIEKHCRCLDHRNDDGCLGELKVVKRAEERMCFENGRHTCTLEPLT